MGWATCIHISSEGLTALPPACNIHLLYIQAGLPTMIDRHKVGGHMLGQMYNLWMYNTLCCEHGMELGYISHAAGHTQPPVR